jgi:hypothetical protein
MATNLESGASENAMKARHRRSNWLKVSAVAAGSAFLGGLAAAWFYRNTLARLRQAEEEIQDSEFESADGRSAPEE